MFDKQYKQYIESKAWERKKALYWRIYGKKCQICGSRQNLHVHHKSYKHLGREPLQDLISLCHYHHLEVHKFHRRHGGTLEQATNRYIYINRKRI